jgi:DNA-binding transcriptional MerR regulator
MIKFTKSPNAYKTIGELAKDLDLINKKTGALQTHTIRYWEKEFKQIKPKIMAGKRRYYSRKDFEIIKFIKLLLKEKGFTISGVKKILNNADQDTLDVNVDLSVYKPNLEITQNFKNKVKKISKLIKELKKI